MFYKACQWPSVAASAAVKKGRELKEWNQAKLIEPEHSAIASRSYYMQGENDFVDQGTAYC